MDKKRNRQPRRHVVVANMAGALNMTAMTGVTTHRRRALPRLARLYAKIAAEDAGVSVANASIEFAASIVETAAYHEAAHAVVGAYFGTLPLLVTIERGSDQLGVDGWGFVRWPQTLRAADRLSTLALIARTGPAKGPLHLSRRDVARHRRALRMMAEDEAMTLLAGIAVERTRDPDSAPIGDALEESRDGFEEDTDVDAAFGALSAFERSPGRRWSWLLDVADRTIALVRTPGVAAAIAAVAETLLDKPTLTSIALERILQPVFATG